MIRERQFEVIKTQQVNQHLLCTICREVFYNPIRATCGHTFCGTCLVRWIQMKKSCPLCRHKLERNYQFDKDILATKIVGDIEVKCLRCQLWEGTLAQFKQHKKSQCTYISTNNEIHQDAIQIGDDDDDFTFAGLVEDTDPQIQQQIIENIGQQILVQIDQSQNQEQQQQQSEQPNHLNTNQQSLILETNSNNNNNINSDQIEIMNQITEINIQPIQNNDLNNPIQQINLETNQQNQIDQQQFNNQQQQQQDISQIPDSNETEEKQLLINNESLIIYQDNQDFVLNNTCTFIQQDNLQQITDIIQNQISTEIKDDITNYNNQSNNIQQSIVEQFKTNDPDVQIIDPPVKFINNKDLKQIKVHNKFKINILKNNVKIAEPMIEEIHDNLFFEFVNHMKKEMVKKLSDIQYYNTLLG